MNINIYIEEKAERVLSESKCYAVPVKVDKCAISLGIKLKPLELDEDVAGFLLIKKGDVHIGYNKNNVQQRVRFTIAHELGHFFLHEKQANLFVDKEEKILYRDGNSSKGEIAKEREANAFAAALLMPRKLIMDEVEKLKNDPQKKSISSLAKKFKVSEQAMTLRLTNLGVIDYDAIAS